MTKDVLTAFMSVISGTNSGMENPLCIGRYTINDGALAWLDGNKLFQRYAVVAGSIDFGKFYTVVSLIEKIAVPVDRPSDDITLLPYWLLTYEKILALMLDRSDANASNQAMVFSQAVMRGKHSLLNESGHLDLSETIT